MSDTTAPLDGVIVDDLSPSFTKELAKSTAVNAAATAGTLAALVATGFIVEKVRQVRTNRAAKKAAVDKTTPTEA